MKSSGSKCKVKALTERPAWIHFLSELVGGFFITMRS